MTNNIEILTAEIIANPSADLYYRRAKLYFSVNKNDLAIQDCNEGLKLNKKHSNCFSLLMDALSDLKRYNEILECCSKAKDLDPDWASPYNGLGLLYYYQNRYNEAINEYNKAIELDSNWAYPHNELGNVYVKTNRYNEAMAEYTKAIELEPDWAYPHNGLGNIYYRIDRYDEAIAEYTKAIELEPHWSYPYNGRGNAYYKQNRYDEAIAEYTKSIVLAPIDSYPYNGRGSTYYKQKRYGESLADYMKAYELFSEDESYYKSLVKVKIDEITALLKSKNLEEKDNVGKIIDKTVEFQNEININKKNKNDFYNHKHIIPYSDNLEFTVLRKWNSFTPIVGSGFRASKGGGYFIKNGDKGIVIDPGFNFIENFMSSGHKFNEIDAVLITHAHNDHAADLDSLLTVLYKYNDDLFGSYSEHKDGSIIDDVLQELKYSREMIASDSEKKKEVVKRVDKRFKEKRKFITFYITSGTFKKYASFLDLMKISNYKIVCVDDKHFNIFEIDDINIRVIKAKHNDIMSDATSVGFCFERNGFVLIYTGDTGFWGMDEYYKKLKDDYYKHNNIVLIANLGGFKDSEETYSINNNVEECYYKNHLGRLGLAKLVEILEPKICIISEFGEEFNGYRIKIAEAFNDVYRNLQNTIFLPADIGLCVNSNMEIRSIINASLSITNEQNYDKDGFRFEFVNPNDVCIGEVEQISELYYYHKDVDAIALAKKKVAKFYESLR